MNLPQESTGTDTPFIEGEFCLYGEGVRIFSNMTKNTKLSEDDKKDLKTAYRIAIEAHGTQIRKSGRPYIEHVEEVILEFLNLSAIQQSAISLDDLIVGLLHDVLEDQPVYFDEIYKTFGYDIVYRIICLSKPESTLFENWKSIIPTDKEVEVQISPLYRLWQFTLLTEGALGNQDGGGAFDVQLNILMHFASNAFSQIPGITIELQKASDDLMLEAQRLYRESIEEVQGDDKLTDVEKIEKCKKRWVEYAASLQLFLLSQENSPIKLADKIHNLSDVEYRKDDTNLTDEDRASRIRKTRSILRTVPIYEFLCELHRFPKKATARLKMVANISRTIANASQVVSPAAQPSS